VFVEFGENESVGIEVIGICVKFGENESVGIEVTGCLCGIRREGFRNEYRRLFRSPGRSGCRYPCCWCREWVVRGLFQHCCLFVSEMFILGGVARFL